MQPYTTDFTLTREYLAESYDQSLPYSRQPNYLFPLLTGVAGVVLFIYTDQGKAPGILLMAFAVLELVHIRYRRAWWLFRQTLGKNANLKVTLTLDDNGVKTRSSSAETQLNWSQIAHVVDTEKGLILVQQNGAKQYLSKSLFNDEQIALIRAVNNDASGGDS